jgi:ABC-2 type transport system permease protein
VMTASLYGALHINAELRQKGIIRKLAATPITRVEWLVSNVLYQLVLAAISTSLILLVSYIAFGVGLRINLWLPLFIILTVVTFVGLGMVLAPIARDAEGASAAGNAILFPMMFLSGTFFPIDLMPAMLQTFAYVLPLYYINEGLRAAMVFMDHWAALQHAAVTSVFAVAVFIGGGLATTWDERT